ncbi:MAG TPA: prolyl oligopeptidase family serine peptidase [Steroidobacteraceae bacterium]|jgi:prolyl oligopeptidase|nr:prolyl oligopeptidase family serine peptidase [Steroidobacteraceae bacterium]
MAGPWHYPPAERGAVVDDYFGTRVADPYRWLEQLDSRQTRSWAVAQNRLSQPWLMALPQRAWIQRRLGALVDYPHFGVPVHEGARYFFTYNSGRQNQSALYVAGELPVAEHLPPLARVLLDPNTLSADATVSLSDFVPDPQGRRVAYALSDAGSDWSSWHVRDAVSGRDLPDLIRFTKFTTVSWARDGSGFYYSRYPVRADGSGDDQRQAVIYFHRLGEPQSLDRLIYAVTDHPTRVPYGTVTDDGRYLVVNVGEGTLVDGIVVLPLTASGARLQRAADGAAPAPIRLLYRFDGMYTFIGSEGDELYFTTTAAAPRTRIIAVDVRDPRPAAWRTVVPQTADVLSQASLVGGHLIAVYLHDAHSLVRVYDRRGGAERDIALPGLGSVAGFQGHDYDRETSFSYTDFFTPPRILRYTLASGVVAALWTPALPADLSPYVTEQVFYTSRDGTRVPMFLVHRRGLARDGRAPVMLYGYGGFDIALTPAYSATALSWLMMGGVYAVANLRGGSEYGEAWHLAGSRLHKQNTFDDFIAAAQYLIRERYTQPARLAISGASNGGLLIGAVMTQRPDLFGAALPAVGVLDMLRYQTASANARQWASDYGTSDDAADFRALYAYSPYQNVRRGTCYPPTLVTTADHDNRVVPWNSYKFAAALQWAQGCEHPVLIRIETRAGHGAGKPLWMQIEDYADQWAFAAEALGMPVPRE